MPLGHFPMQVLVDFPASARVGEASAVLRSQWWAESWQLKFTGWPQAPSSFLHQPFRFTSSISVETPWLDPWSNTVTCTPNFPSTITDPMRPTLYWLLDTEEPSALRHRWEAAGVQPRLIQGIRRRDGIGDLFIYLFRDIKNNRMRIAQ